MIKANYTYNDKHPLSEFWSHSRAISSNRLNFFGKGITYIDKLKINTPEALSAVKELDLSHNALSKL